MRLANLLLIVIAIAGCYSNPHVPQPPAPHPPGVSSCAAACQTLVDLCDEFADIGVEACSKACSNAQDNGVDFHLACLSGARTPPEVLDCGSSRCTPR